MTGQLARSLPELSRFAVMQHLSVLEEAGLVLARREGRTRLNYLNPIPLRELYERWMSSHASTAAETALRLKRYAEQTKEMAQNMDQKEFRLVEIELELRVDAPIERVYKALTEELDAWWPHRYKPDSTVHADVVVGGKIEERFKGGGGALYGEFLYFDPPTKIVSGGSSVLCRGYAAYTVDNIEATPEGGTVVKRKFQIWGAVPQDAEDMYRSGVASILQKAFADYMERGIGYSPAGSK
jgi:DNA-binding transcriptional ArsR family regulator